MNRRKFFKKIGAATAVTIIAPSVLLSETPKAIAPKVRATDGLFHQLQRGNIHQYGAITRDQIKEAVEYVFRDKEMAGERKIKFQCGPEVYKTMQDLFKAA